MGEKGIHDTIGSYQVLSKDDGEIVTVTERELDGAEERSNTTSYLSKK